MESSSLRAATARAVAENRELVRRTARQLTDLAGSLRRTDPPDDGRAADQVTAAALHVEQTVLAAVTSTLNELAEEQLTGMNTFNITLFGRTGAGKSSLLEALTSGNGDSISPGLSDWTKDVKPVDWETCQVVDTPGIQGWGRDTDRNELEDRARHALITADVVLLCFDSIHQQAGEFAKVADWVAKFGKPAAAVLNVRDADWRLPDQVEDRATRLELSQSVAEHASHIGEVLTTIGLADTPLVALHAQRAAFARVTEPCKVPKVQLRSMRKLRAAYGTEQLLEWSNVPLLERLLAAVVDKGASDLRRGMLLRQVGAALDAAAARLLTTVEGPTRESAEQAERGLEQMLAVLGAPEGHVLTADGTPDPDVVRLRARMSRLEAERGGGLQAPAVGAAERHGRDLVDVALGPLRLEAAQTAEVLVDEAMLAQRKVDSAEFQRKVFDEAAIEQAMKEAVAELSDYLEARVGLAAEDVVADLRAVQRTSSTVQGAAGRGYRWSSTGVGAGSAAAVITVALVNVWNPVGWGLLVGSIAVGLAGPMIAKWLRKRGVRAREKEFSRARATARQAVAETFDGLRDQLVTWFGDAARQALTVRLGAAVEQALLLRRVCRTAIANDDALTGLAKEFRGEISVGSAATTILAQAVRCCEDGVEGRTTRRWLWLGESWCDDPNGLTDRSSRSQTAAAPPSAGPVGLGPRVTERLEAVLDRVVATPAPGTGRAWLTRVGPLLADDPDAAPILVDLYRILADDRPNVLIYGDYNAGKSSFVRRLLVDDGERVPRRLRVGAAPKTTDVAPYDWGGLRLVDTPGLQSGRPGHAAAAQAALPGAALVLYMIGASTVVGDRSGLDLILRGDPERGVVAKLDRTVFVVNRADELGVNPFDDDEGFAELLARKERELRSALVAAPEVAGVSVPVERIVFVASDPGGRVGTRTDVKPADFDRRRTWDGMDEIRAVLRRFGPQLRKNCRDVGVLHSGLARLSDLAGSARQHAARLDEKLTQLDRVADDIRELTENGDLIDKRARDALARTVVGHVDQLVDDALMATEAARETILNNAVRFWRDPELQQKLDQWTATTRRDVDQWAKEADTVLRRRIDSQAYQQAMPDTEGLDAVRFPGKESDGSPLRRTAPAVARAVEVVAKARAAEVVRLGLDASARVLVASMAERGAGQAVNVVRAILMRKNALAQGARIARVGSRASKVGAGLQVITGVADFVLLIRDQRGDKRREREFEQARQRLREQADGFAVGLAERDAALAALGAGADALDEAFEAVLAKRAQRRSALNTTNRRLGNYETAIQLGWSALAEEGRS